MADIYHMLHYDERDQYWKCSIGVCSAKYHDEDIQKSAYSGNHDHTLYLCEADFENSFNETHEEEKCTNGETKTSDGTGSIKQSAISMITSSDGDE